MPKRTPAPSTEHGMVLADLDFIINMASRLREARVAGLGFNAGQGRAAEDADARIIATSLAAIAAVAERLRSEAWMPLTTAAVLSVLHEADHPYAK